jgi:hypothetical protein
MIGASCIEKLLKVISGLPHLALEVTLSYGDELLIEVVDLFVVVALVKAGSDRDSLGSPLQPPLVGFGAPLCTLADCLEWCPQPPQGGTLSRCPR